MKLFILFFLANFALFFSCSTDDTILRGKVVALNNQTPENIMVTLIDKSVPWDSSNSVTLKNGGDFKIRFADKKARLFFLIASAPGYKRLEVPILNNQTEITIDILLASNNDPEDSYLTFKDSNSRNAKLSLLYFKILSAQQQQKEAYHKNIKTKMEADQRPYDASEILTFISENIKDETNPIIRDFLYLSYASFALGKNIETSIASSALKEVTPTSAAWSINHQPNSLANFVLMITGTEEKWNDNFSKYEDKILARHSDPELKSSLLLRKLVIAKLTHDTLTYQNAYTTLVNDYGKTSYGKKAKGSYKANMEDLKVKPGTLVPNFKFASLDDSLLTFSNDYFKGKIYLIDFWASWCAPCLKEIPYLEKAYKKHQKDGLEILSISRDYQKTDIAQYRNKYYPMPWKHVWLKNKEAVYKTSYDFEVVVIPKVILVGQDGKIIAVDEGLHKDDLAKTLAKVFAK